MNRGDTTALYTLRKQLALFSGMHLGKNHKANI